MVSGHALISMVFSKERLNFSHRNFRKQLGIIFLYSEEVSDQHVLIS